MQILLEPVCAVKAEEKQDHLSAARARWQHWQTLEGSAPVFFVW